MKVSFEKIVQFSLKRVDFYTIKLGENELTEFENFIEKDFPKHDEELQIMYASIEAIQGKGANTIYFKNESNADAMSVVPHAIMDANTEDYGIRLYCIRLTDRLVVLFNGDIKTHINPLHCENVRIHFRNAIKIATKLDSLRLNKDIDFLEPDCLAHLEIEI